MITRQGFAVGFLLLVVGLVTTHAQPTGPNAKNANWKVHTNKNGNFTAEFPATAVDSTTKNKAGEITAGSTTTVIEGNTHFTVQYQVNTLKMKEADILEMIGVKVFAQKAKDLNRKVTLGDHPGIEFTTPKTLFGKEKLVRSRVFVVNNTVYQVNVITAPDGTVPEEMIARFYNSFKLTTEDSKSTAYVPRKEGAGNVTSNVPMPKDPLPKGTIPPTKTAIVDEKYTPGPSSVNPKAATIEKAQLAKAVNLPQPRERLVPALGTIRGPGDARSYAFGPDGSFFAVGTSKDVWLYDTGTGKAITHLPGGTSKFRTSPGIRFSPDAKTMVTFNEQTVFIVDVTKREIIKQIAMTGRVQDAILSDDGTILSIGYINAKENTVKFSIFDAKTMAVKQYPLPEHIHSLWAFTANGTHLVVTQKQFFATNMPAPPVEVWNLQNGHRSILPVTEGLTDLRIHADHRTLAYVTTQDKNNDAALIVMDMVTGKKRNSFKVRAYTRAPQFTGDGNYILVDQVPQGQTFLVKMLEVNTGKEVWSHDLGSTANYYLSPGMQFIARIPYFLDSEVDLLAMEKVIAKNKTTDLAQAMDAARQLGFDINSDGEKIWATVTGKNFNANTFADLAKVLPQVNVIVIPYHGFITKDLIKAFPDLAKFTELERFSSRLSFGKEAGVRQVFASLKKLRVLELADDDVGLEVIPQIPQLEELRYWVNRELTDVGMKHILNAKKLKKLTITGNGIKVSNAVFANLSNLTELEVFSSRGGGGGLDGGVFTHLAKCPKLMRVELLDADITDAHLLALSRLTQLKEIWLMPTLTVDQKRRTDNGLQQLATLKNLRYLQIDSNGMFTAKGFKGLSLSKLEVAILGGVEFTDSDIPLFKTIPNLRELGLTRAKCSPEALLQLKTLNNLERLTLQTGGPFKQDQVLQLEKANPKLVVEFGF